MLFRSTIAVPWVIKLNSNLFFMNICWLSAWESTVDYLYLNLWEGIRVLLLTKKTSLSYFCFKTFSHFVVATLFSSQNWNANLQNFEATPVSFWMRCIEINLICHCFLQNESKTGRYAWYLMRERERLKVAGAVLSTLSWTVLLHNRINT